MSEAIRFLDSIGAAAALAPSEYGAAVSALGVDDAQKNALLQRDDAALALLLEARATMMCIISAPQEEEPEPSQDDEPEPGEQHALQ